jgi:hypothetical protein
MRRPDVRAAQAICHHEFDGDVCRYCGVVVTLTPEREATLTGRVQPCPNEHTTGTCQGCKDYAEPVQSGRVQSARRLARTPERERHHQWCASWWVTTAGIPFRCDCHLNAPARTEP